MRRAEAERAADYRAGLIAALFRNIHRPKGAKASDPSDFFPSLREDRAIAAAPRGQSPEAMLAIFQMITGAKVKVPN